MFLTIDSGGSKTKLTLWDNKQNKLAEKHTLGYGIAEDNDEIHSLLYDELTDFCADFSVKSVICNLGGKNKNQITKTIVSAFPNASVNVFRESEGLAGMILCEKTGSQVALLAGTGSIAVAPCKNKAVISGGWGANIGDSGSGYDLGLQAIRSSLEQLDSTNPMSPLAKDITGVSEPPLLMSAIEYCNLRDCVRNRIGPFNRSNIAKYAKTVAKFAEQGDIHALKLFDKSGVALADLVISTNEKTGIPLKRIIVTGGLINSLKFWKNSFEERLSQKHHIEKIFYLKDGIDDALYILAKKSIG